MPKEKLEKGLWITKKTHKLFKKLCVENEKNFDEMIIELMKKWKIKN